ncbi:MAG: hypothetical protein HQL49_02700 [Gammaproteobacteria bacterium]|nr:hypothetical protein [Gammaproteobacteria bacterium]
MSEKEKSSSVKTIKVVGNSDAVSSLLKLLLSLVMVFVTYNSFSNFHAIHLLKQIDLGDMLHWAYLLIFIGGWLLVLVGVYKNLQKIGVAALIIISVLIIGGLIQRDAISPEDTDMLVNLGELATALIIYIGLSWPEIRRKLFGVRTIDDDDGEP